jgi:hypothetical protein
VRVLRAHKTIRALWRRVNARKFNGVIYRSTQPNMQLALFRKLIEMLG